MPTTEQQEKAIKLSELKPQELAEMIVEVKEAIRQAEMFCKELEHEMLNHIGRGQFITVNRDFEIDGSVVNIPVEIRHKSRQSLRYNNKQVIRVLKEVIPNPSQYIELETVEKLDKSAFESDLYKFDDLKPLRPFVQPHESDWCEVRGLPK